MMYKWFNPIPKELETLKKQYRQLAKAHHPDLGGNTADMQTINNEFDKLYAELERAKTTKHNTGATHTSNANHTGKASTARETAAAFREIIEKLITLDGVEIEIIGSWLWLTGNTYEHKEAIKALGFKWSKSKKSWYFHFEPYRKTSRKTFTMSELRDLYGSEYINKGDRLKLTVV